MHEKEFELLNKLGDVWNDFCKLQNHHPDDLDCVRSHVHSIQHLIMARYTRRGFPKYFNAGSPT